MPSDGLTIRGGEEQSLELLLAEFGRVTGENVMISADTGRDLNYSSTELIGDLQIAQADVYSVVQDILIQSRFALIDLRRQEPRMLSVLSLDSPARTSGKDRARYVPSERLGEYALDSALLIQTVIDLPNTDLRAMKGSFRALVTDPSTITITPLPESRQLIIIGFGKYVNDLARMVRCIDRASEQRSALDEEGDPHETRSEGTSLSPLPTVSRHSPPDERPPHSELFPVPSRGLLIREGESQNLTELLALFAEATGERVHYDEDTRSVLRRSRTGLVRSLEVAPANVYTVVQDILIRNGLALLDVRREDPRMLSVVSLDSPDRASIKHRARYVSSERLREYALDSALLIQTVIDVPNVDLRELRHSFRALIVDRNTTTLLPLVTSGQILLLGSGETVNYLASVLWCLDQGRWLGEASDQERVLYEALLKAADRRGIEVKKL